MPSPEPVSTLFELKYCERCGSLWLRPQGGDAIYCSPCLGLMGELPVLRPTGRSAGFGPISALILVFGAVEPWLEPLLEALA